jgi:hypothetical protein
MNKDFINLTQKIVREKGKDILDNAKPAKALFMDYSHGEYRNEINLLLKTIELGYYNKIKNEPNPGTLKLLLTRQLVEDHSIIEEKAVQIVSLLVSLIKDEEYSSTENYNKENMVNNNTGKCSKKEFTPPFNANDKIEIFSSFLKYLWMFLIFACGGSFIQFIFRDYLPDLYPISPVSIVVTVVRIAVAFVGFIGLIIIAVVWRKKPQVIIIDNTGIKIRYDQFITDLAWQNIIAIRAVKRKLLSIILDNPDDFINRQEYFSRKDFKNNYEKFGSPVVISTDGLAHKDKRFGNKRLIFFKNKEFEDILQEQLKKWKSNG